MTRVIIFGDLHANWEALLALQQAERRPDAVLCLGDIVGYGPDPKRCLDAVRASVTHLIGGVHDRAMGKDSLTTDATKDFSRDEDLLEASWTHTRSMLSAEERTYLASLPTQLTVEVAGTRFHLTRLMPDDLESESRVLVTMPQAQLRERFGDVEADIILLGGTHVPALRQVGDRLIVCPGSLGLPRYGVPDPTFAAWQDGRVQVHHLHYHPQHTIRKLSLLPLPPEYVLRLQSILQTGGLE
ncbi:MAG: metallophosphoesterase family protein [Anaerolineales bacterium]|nr:MAG: metallophosphoesterase family protein [Anaerolineales bacterium]